MPPKKRISSTTTTTCSAVRTTSKSSWRCIEVVPAGTSPKVPVPSPVKETNNHLIKCFYPRENMKLATELEGTMKGIERAMSRVLDDHVVRSEVPVKTITSISKNVQEKLVEWKVERTSWDNDAIDEALEDVLLERKGNVSTEGNDELNEEVLDNEDVLSENADTEGNDELNEKVFDDELIKYGLIGSSQFEQLSMGTLLSMVRDICTDEFNLLEYESGYPTKTAPSVLKFYNLDEDEFRNLSERKRTAMVKKYIEQGFKYHMDMKTFLEKKYESMLKKNEFNDGNVHLEDLFEAFEKNKALRKRLKEEYERIIDKEKTEMSPCRESYRELFLNGKIGMRREGDEELLDVLFEKTPEETKNIILNQYKEIVEDTTIELGVSDVPNRNTKARNIEYTHSFIPVPNIFLRSDNYV